MKKLFNCINSFIFKFSSIFVKVLLIMIIIGMICLDSVYLYEDAPAIRPNFIYKYLAIIMCAIMLYLIVLVERKINGKITTKNRKKYLYTVFFIYFVMEIIFIILLPLKPFSDMEEVVKIAMSDFRENIEYIQIYPNNLPTSLLFNILFRFTIHNYATIKILNIFCNIITIYYTYKIFDNIYKQKNGIVLLLGLCEIPAFLYANYVYNDVIFTTFTTIILYIITKKQERKIDFWILNILLFLQYVIRPVGIVFVIAVEMYYVFKEKNIKKFIVVLLVFLILNFMHIGVKKIFIPESDEVKEYPIWSFIQMGINEWEIGFQNASHSQYWTFAHVKRRIKRMGVKGLTSVLSRKIFWQWTEGTYQAELYGFGVYDDGFEYETFLTEKVKGNENSMLRYIIEYIIKGQYFIISVLSFIGVIIKNEDEETNKKIDLLYLFIMGIFSFYVIWEMKSRYIYCLYPIFIILASKGIKNIYECKEYKKLTAKTNDIKFKKV